MEKILKYIDENYSSIISKKEVEELFCYSHRNSQRLFKRFFNETISNFQKRLKLENAYKRLVYTSETIKNIAYDVGYENQSSFTKAFKKQFKVSPSDARRGKDVLFNTFIEQSKKYNERIDYELLYLQSRVIYYKLILTDNYNNETINNLWDEIDIAIEGCENINYYGLILDQPLISAKTKCRYEACIDSNQNTASYLTKKIFGRKYLKFNHFGDFDSIEDTYRQIYYNWIGYLNFEIDSSPIIEHYLKDSRNTDNKNEYHTVIYIPLK